MASERLDTKDLFKTRCTFKNSADSTLGYKQDASSKIKVLFTLYRYNKMTVPVLKYFQSYNYITEKASLTVLKVHPLKLLLKVLPT